MIQVKNRTQFGIYLKGKRQSKMLSQKDLSVRLGYSSAQFISNIERGLAMVPKHQIQKIAKILGHEIEKIYVDVIMSEMKLEIQKTLGR